ncbi:MAG: hypothetical protein QM770_23160 [Tepidisphaeraceae bacterium]
MTFDALTFHHLASTFFNAFRYLGFVFVTIYFLVTTAQNLWGYYVWLSAKDRYTGMLRNYLIVHGLRLRVRPFMWDLVICGLLCVAFLIMWYAHNQVNRIALTLESIPR